MKEIEIVEAEKAYLLKQLNSLYPKVALMDLPSLAERLETTLRDHIRTVLRAYSDLLFEAHSNEEAYFMVLKDGNLPLSLSVANDLRNHGVLCVRIYPAQFVKSKELEFPIIIDGHGQVSQIAFLYPKLLPARLDLITSLLKNLFEVGYHWFENRVEELASDEKVALSRNLYRYMRDLIPSDSLRAHLWFATVTKGYGFRLIDREVANSVFDAIAPHAEKFGISTHRLASEMLATKLPQEKLLMPKAIALNKIMDVNISEAKYSEEGSIYSAAMTAFYGCDSFTIHPVMKREHTNVVCLYPTDKRKDLEPVIAAHLPRIEEMCEASISKVHAAMKLFDISVSSASKWGQFVGGFFRGFLEQ